MATIVLDSVTKRFQSGGAGTGEVLAVNDVSFTIADCEVVCLVGPSGCGKSTILNLIAGFEAPSSGRILVGSQPISGAGPDRMVVFQSPALFGWMTVHQNVVLGPKKQGVPKQQYESDARRFIDAVGLSEFSAHYPYQLSGGMRQRVQIARALVNRPAVLLMDEPFGALDFQTRLLMQELLSKVWSEFQPTILFITHDVDEAIFLGDRVYVMSRRPGTLKEQLHVQFPKPRSMEMLTDPSFVRMKEEILYSIKEELAGSI
jgi:NitT/TauT family transport system ATP-binding protein